MPRWRYARRPLALLLTVSWTAVALLPQGACVVLPAFSSTSPIPVGWANVQTREDARLLQMRLYAPDHECCNHDRSAALPFPLPYSRPWLPLLYPLSHPSFSVNLCRASSLTSEICSFAMKIVPMTIVFFSSCNMKF